ncbi:hypothetical protein RJT34_07408 [Clitoria ternatea]|uniref:Uncharacterized protein n=1 Tax=Clitoria ternatea TaxID=43366 RepID=A0AAN9K5T6_CLITE
MATKLTGAIVFNSIGRTQYGFDVFSVDLHNQNPPLNDNRLTDGTSVNFNTQFSETESNDIVFISEQTGFHYIYMTRPESPPQALPFVPASLFHDRPTLKNGTLYFVSTHDEPDPVFKGCSAVYSTSINGNKTLTRITPQGVVDFSLTVSLTGKFIAVASYGSRQWGTNDFRELKTDITVFEASNPENRVVMSEQGGWPTWSQDSTIFFHKITEDGWWSIFRVELNGSDLLGSRNSSIHVTSPGLHCFTPVAFNDGKRIAVATRQKGNKFHHIEVFELESKTFQRITESINPNFHHYNPFVSSNSRYLGFHRFRGESTQGESKILHLELVLSPVPDLQLIRLNDAFPGFSPKGDFIALNHIPYDHESDGIKIVRSNGSKRWTLLKGFLNSWSPTEEHVIYTSTGPTFESFLKTVQIAQIEFDQVHLEKDIEEVPFKLKILTRDDTGNNAFPSCSPDGKSIVFRSGRFGHKNLYIVDTVNGEFNGGLRRLTEGEWIDTMPCWSPKGDLIAFSSNRHEAWNSEVFWVYMVRPDGSGLRRVEVAKWKG